MDYITQQAEEDFYKARNKAFINEIQHLLSPEEADLISLNDVKQLIKPQNETYIGMKVIPIEKIVGSEGRYKDFDNRFFPKSSFLRTRWEHVDEAAIKAIDLPPIKVYELAGLYFVRDGNHRVSVAKARGVEFIDAEVVSLQSEIKLKKANNINDIIKQIIYYEKRVFYAETSFDLTFRNKLKQVTNLLGHQFIGWKIGETLATATLYKLADYETTSFKFEYDTDVVAYAEFENISQTTIHYYVAQGNLIDHINNSTGANYVEYTTETQNLGSAFLTSNIIRLENLYKWSKSSKSAKLSASTLSSSGSF